ncbi:DUF1549 domain-containing protein [Verrucomicrobiales bacterium BCK34]|nr:DUF1549 domain-containing protein [Verrucomicrobiales bacterium BCK34]
MKSRFICVLWISLVCVSVNGAPTDYSKAIDSLVNEKLVEQGIQPNGDASDAIFLRRAYLDIVGRIPTLKESAAFSGDTYENKRERLIDELLGSEGYVSDSYHFWADLLRINGEPGATVSAAYGLWVKDALRKNMPYDEMVYSLVTAEGKFWENGAVGYYFRDRGMPLDNMSNTVRVFLGTRLECAQCHNHPFDKWTQMDYFKMASFSFGMVANNYGSPNRALAIREAKGEGAVAYHEKARELTGRDDFPYFARAEKLNKFVEAQKSGEGAPVEKGRKKNKRESRVPYHVRTEMSLEAFVKVAEESMKAAEGVAGNRSVMREVINELYDPLQYVSVTATAKNSSLPHDYQYEDAKPKDTVPASTMFGAAIDLSSEEGKIEAYGKWLTSPENPTFTRVIVNRLWKEVFGQGIFEPVDELTEQTTITNPALLDYLEEVMRELDYDLVAFQSVLYNTSAYQRSAHTGEVELGSPYYFQGPLLRRMSAEQIWDSLVALALPEADRYQPNLKKELSSIERVKRIYESLEERSFDELMEVVKEIMPIVEAQQRDADSYRELIAEARAADDVEAIQALRKKYGGKKKELSRAISGIAYKGLDEKIDGGELLLAMGFIDAGSALGQESEMTDGEPDGKVNYITTSLPSRKEAMRAGEGNGTETRRMRKKGSGGRGGSLDERADMRAYQNLISGMARASELPSPAKRGHFLRDFGQSDREVIENASTHASVPQALNLLNSSIVEALVNPFSHLGESLQEVNDVDDKARMIFQAMLTRDPSEAELETVRLEIEEQGDAGYEGIIWALLNTQQFLFVE